MRYYIGADTGGTFTDLVILDEAGRLYFDKAFSTPAAPDQGVLAALENCAGLLKKDLHELLQDAERFSHGTTVGTNALIQRRGAKVGLIMTKGFEDTILITRGPMGKNLGIPPSQAMDFIHNERPEALVPKMLIRSVTERVAVDGAIIAPLLEDDVRQALKDLLGAGVESIAVCLLWSFRNDVHEKKIKAIIHDVDGKVSVNLSSDVSPVLGEFERAVTTVVNAYVGPVIVRYLTRLQAALAGKGLRRPVQALKCSGGLTLPQHLEKEAVSIVNSGPVGGLVAAQYLGESLGYRNIITTDMGGTSFDVGVIHKGELEEERLPFLSQGIPVQVPAVKVVAIGAGGGSIAWTDGRRLLVGPRSAGADPGPACYDQGGSEPTVTDALVVLGLVDPNYFFGGRKQLVKARAERAIQEKIGLALGLELREAAAGIYEIVTAKMADLIRKVTVESGYDPREFILFAYGGAAGAHAALYGSALGVKEVIVPHTAAVFSALGTALSDVKYSYTRSEPLIVEATPAFLARFREVFRELDDKSLEDMKASGFSSGEVVLNRKLDVRYEGQMNEITVPWDRDNLDGDGIAALRSVFERTYETRFGEGTTRSESPLEIMSFRVEALKITEKPELRPCAEEGHDPGRAAKGAREVYLRQFGSFAAAAYEYDRLAPGNRVVGPAIVERRDTTVFVPPDHIAVIDGYWNIRIQIGGESYESGPNNV